MKKLLTLLALTMVMVMITGCSPRQQGRGVAERDTVRMAIQTDFTIFDPMNSGMLVDSIVYNNIYDRLIVFFDGEYEKVLVEDYSITPDGLNYNVRLKRGVRFHNGEEFKASDVIFSLLRSQDSRQYASMTGSIQNVVAHDDYNVTITLSESYVPFLQAVLASVPMMNEKAVNDAGDNVGFQPVGTGPYRYISFEPGQRVTLEAFDGWHGGNVPIRHAIFVVITDPSSSLMAVEAGDVDLTYSIPTIEAGRLENSPNVNFARNATTGSGFILYNLDKPPFNDINFRLAFAHAINRQEIVDVGMEGVAEISYALWDHRYEGYSGRYSPPEYDPDRAREYLARSSYNGETLYFRVGMEIYRRITLLVQEQLRQIGVNVEVEMMETNAWVSDMRSGNYDISTIVMTYNLDVDYWANVLHTSAIGHFNFPRFSRPEVDDAFDRGRTILDREERRRTYDVIERIINQEAPIIAIYFRVTPMVTHRDLIVSRVFPNGAAEVIDISWR